MSETKPNLDVPASSKESRNPDNSHRESNRDPRRRFRTRKKQNRPVASRVKFEGRERKIKEFIYDCAELRQSIDSYIKSTDEIALFAGVNMRLEHMLGLPWKE